jgi:hypothetical protein
MTKQVETKNADALYQAGEFAAAEQAYREILAAEPSHPHALFRAGTLALWRNDLAAAILLLETAQKERGWWQSRWPMRTEGDVRLALAYGRAGRLREAMALLEKAAGPMKVTKELVVRARLLALFGDKRPYQMKGATEAVLPFVVTDPLPVVMLSVNGAPEAPFFIDTGGEGLILDRDYAREVGAQMVGEAAGEYVGGKGATGYGKVERVAFGPLYLEQVPTCGIDLQPVRKAVFPTIEIKGTVGTGLLQPFLATLDYPHGQLVLRRPESALPEQPRATAIPFWWVETHLLLARGQLNELRPQPMLIDTGLADGGFLTSQGIYEQAGVTVDWSKALAGAGGGGEARGAIVTVPRVTLGQGTDAIVRTNLRGVVLEKDLSFFDGALGFTVGGVISHQFFRDSAVTFDFRRMQLVIIH